MSAIAATPSAGHAAVGTEPYGAGEQRVVHPLWPTPRRVAFVGPQVWLDACAPPSPTAEIQPHTFAIDASGAVDGGADALAAFDPHATVVIDPLALSAELRSALATGRPAGVTVGVLVGGAPPDDAPDAGFTDRLVSFDPGLTGAAVGSTSVWRAIPPPIADTLFADVRPLHRAPRPMTIGAATAHRERMLAATKHHHDLMQVLHGVTGAVLVELMGEYDVGVYVPPTDRAGFGAQVGMHLAAGHLLVSSALAPAHGLERDIDYVQVDSADALAILLERVGRFPEMYHRIRVRGRMKAEQYRASRLFTRLVYDLLADVAAFGHGATAKNASRALTRAPVT